jgi:hypothetical protein
VDEAAIDQFREQLTDAAAFAGPETSVAARTSTLVALCARGAFPEWLMVTLGALAEQCAAGNSAGVAVLTCGRTSRCYEQWPNERGIGFIRRLAVQSRLYDEPWLCVALRDNDGVMWWYAEARGSGVGAARVGRLGSDGDGDAFTGEPIHPSESHSLGRILLGHPARRRFPLRRG